MICHPWVLSNFKNFKKNPEFQISQRTYQAVTMSRRKTLRGPTHLRPCLGLWLTNLFLSSGGLFGSVIREFWNFWGSSIVAPKVFSVAAELVGKPEKTDTWQKKQEGEVNVQWCKCNFSESKPAFFLTVTKAVSYWILSSTSALWDWLKNLVPHSEPMRVEKKPIQCLAMPRFPVLRVGYMHLLRNFIGSLVRPWTF